MLSSLSERASYVLKLMTSTVDLCCDPLRLKPQIIAFFFWKTKLIFWCTTVEGLQSPQLDPVSVVPACFESDFPCWFCPTMLAAFSNYACVFILWRQNCFFRPVWSVCVWGGFKRLFELQGGHCAQAGTFPCRFVHTSCNTSQKICQLQWKSKNKSRSISWVQTDSFKLLIT